MKNSEEIWNEYHSSLLSFIKRRVEYSDAEDILQDVFLKVHEKMNTLQNDMKLESWLYQITRNSIVDYYRIRKPSSESPNWLFNEQEDQEDCVRRELSMCLLPMIKKLPEIYRSALYISGIESNRSCINRKVKCFWCKIESSTREKITERNTLQLL